MGYPTPVGIHVWYIYLHLVDFYTKCRYIHLPYMDSMGTIVASLHTTIISGIQDPIPGPLNETWCIYFLPTTVRPRPQNTLFFFPVCPKRSHWSYECLSGGKSHLRQEEVYPIHVAAELGDDRSAQGVRRRQPWVAHG